MTPRRPLALAALLGLAAAVGPARAEGPVEPPKPPETKAPEPPPPPFPAEPPHTAAITPEEWLWEAAWLSDDARQGRLTGSPECREAAAWIAGRMKAMGLEPVPGGKGYLHPWTLPGAKAVAEKCSLEIAVGEAPAAKPRGLAWGKEYVVFAGVKDGEASGALVFAGYGIRSKDPAFDDYAGIDAKGKVVLLLRHEPREKDPKSRWNGDRMTAHSAFLTKVRAAVAAGAAGVLIANDPLNHERDELDGAVLGGPDQSIPVAMVRRAVADELLRPLQATLADLQKKIDDADAPASAAVPGVRVSLVVRARQEESDNVAGMVRGSDPALREEFVVVGGHYDHVGLGQGGGLDPRRYGQVHNGADDNASGSAAVLEVAEWFALSKERPRRSVIFIAFSGEEEGLFGSRAWVTKPPVPNEKVVGMVNLDMVGRYRPGRFEVVGAASGSTLKAIVEKANEGLGLELRHTNAGMSSSDGLSFHDVGIPTMFLFTDLHEDYHRPGDDWWKLNAEGAARVTTLAARTARALADAAERPLFSKIERSEMPLGMRRPILGVRFDEESSAEGATLTAVVPESPAAKAGLLVGDRIVLFAGKKVRSHAEMRDLIAGVKPGEKAAGKAVRADATIDFTVEFPAPRPPAPPPPPRIGVSWAADGDGKPGVVLQDVTAEGPAAKAGVLAGDRILAVGGQAVADAAALQAALAKLKPGDTVEVKVLRDGKEVVASIALPK